jgi:septal ring factor EnvC (AmiA/AmiB activator)
MLGLVSKKKYDSLDKSLNSIVTKQQEMLDKKDFEISRLSSELKNQKKISFDLNNEVLDLKETNRKLGNDIDMMEVEVEEEIKKYKKDIKNLKALCTKNKLDYSKLFKEVK